LLPFHNFSALVTVLSQMYPIHNLPTRFFKIHINFTALFKLKSSIFLSYQPFMCNTVLSVLIKLYSDTYKAFKSCRNHFEGCVVRCNTLKSAGITPNGHDRLWREISYYKIFRYSATFDMSSNIATNRRWQYIWAWYIYYWMLYFG